MYCWPVAVEIARQLARQQGTSHVVAECMTCDPREQQRFVIGPARGWAPRAERFVIRAKVADVDLSLTVLGGWEPPVESTS